MTLNISLLTELRDFIITHPEKFSMTIWRERADVGTSPAEALHDCGTVCCIGGWVETMIFAKAGLQDYMDEYGFTTEQLLDKASIPYPGQCGSLAASALGLTSDQAGELFAPTNYGDPELYPVDRVLRTINHLIETGEIDWNI